MIQELTKARVSAKLPQRVRDAHKGTFGKVLVMAGSKNYPGAAYLACAAAYRTGVGLVTLAADEEVKIIVSRKLPEATFLYPDEAVERIGDYDVILLGPGLGQTREVNDLVKKVITSKFSTAVIDGDGLNLLSTINEWEKKVKGEIVLTPHPGEMARLARKSIEEIERNRLKSAEDNAEKWGTVVVLKGANTLIASPAGETVISPFANPLLATAGTGDVLAGIIAGLVAQGMKIFDAAAAGVYIHGAAGEILRERIGEAGLLAGDLLTEIPLILKQLR